MLGFPGSTAITNSIEALFLDCDILVPAASEMQIHRNNCDFIKAKVIAEAANGPVTVGAEEHLLKQNKMIIPDLLLNAGGVTVSYFEWLKNLSHVRFGRINKKWEEHGKNQLVEFVETEMGRRLSPEAKQAIVSGADEEMLVHSGLEDTMINAVKETRNTARAKVLLICWLEEACHLLVAIDVVALKLCVSIISWLSVAYHRTLLAVLVFACAESGLPHCSLHQRHQQDLRCTSWCWFRLHVDSGLFALSLLGLLPQNTICSHYPSTKRTQRRQSKVVSLALLVID